MEGTLTFSEEVMESINQRLEAGESEPSLSADIKVLESTVRKRFKMGTVPASLDHCKALFSGKRRRTSL
jgi:hypothetical protein